MRPLIASGALAIAVLFGTNDASAQTSPPVGCQEQERTKSFVSYAVTSPPYTMVDGNRQYPELLDDKINAWLDYAGRVNITRVLQTPFTDGRGAILTTIFFQPCAGSAVKVPATER